MARYLLILAIFLVLIRCATDPGTSTPVSGGAVTKFTYEKGELGIVVNLNSSRLERQTQITAAAVLFDINSSTGQRTQATELDTGVTVDWPTAISFTLPNCSAAPTLLASQTYTTYKIFNYRYPDTCTISTTERVSAQATLTVNKTGFAAKTIGGSGGSNSSAPTYYTIFITSTSYPGSMGGLSGVDAKCAARAAVGTQTSSLGGTWRAIVSTSTQNAKDRLSFTSSLPIKNTNGDTVLSAASSLWGGVLSGYPKYDENGVSTSNSAWTGSDSAGVYATNNCTDWTNSVFLISGVVGSGQSLGPHWLEKPSDDTCNLTDSLYCINANQ